jgi:hypothetical protein
MSETTHIAFQTPTEKATFRSSPNAVEGEASTPSKDEGAAFGASNENPNAFAGVYANVLEIDKKKKQVGKKKCGCAMIGLLLILASGISRLSSSMVICDCSIPCKA